jgi:hypothetical protein
VIKSHRVNRALRDAGGQNGSVLQTKPQSFIGKLTLTLGTVFHKSPRNMLIFQLG